ncbi:response regulator transcription factor [Psychromonas sp. SP041]|uniref:response regulator transcription factor n=1 Tax=Psychromonas sp. SP041 TaxID=1365007 RepID=UPI0003FEF573|nr:response regulator transcription factor [Psychromonas sp. SP041]
MSYIVVVSDNLQSRRLLTQVLTKAAHQVTCLSDAKSTLTHLQQQGADVVILDNEFSNDSLMDTFTTNTLSSNVENAHDLSTNLSSKKSSDSHQSDAYVVAKETHKLISTICKRFATPILLLSETGDQENLLDKLKAGADQYLNKPYSEQALLVHIEVLLRRVALEKQRATFDNCTERFSFKISRLPLTDTEVQLVQYLSKNDGDIISKATLQKEVLKRELSAFDRNLDVHISNIRRKMCNAGLSKLHIKTVHGKGYAFSEKVAQLSCMLMCFLTSSNFLPSFFI